MSVFQNVGDANREAQEFRKIVLEKSAAVRPELVEGQVDWCFDTFSTNGMLYATSFEPSRQGRGTVSLFACPETMAPCVVCQETREGFAAEIFDDHHQRVLVGL